MTKKYNKKLHVKVGFIANFKTQKCFNYKIIKGILKNEYKTNKSSKRLDK